MASETFEEMEARWAKRRRELTEFLKTIGQEYPRCGFDVGDGWFPHVKVALTKIAALDIPWKLGQVKQKFLELRIYIDFPNNGKPPWIWQEEHPLYSKYKEAEAAIDEAATKCDRACETCGAEVKPGFGVGLKLCDTCRAAERVQ